MSLPSLKKFQAALAQMDQDRVDEIMRQVQEEIDASEPKVLKTFHLLGAIDRITPVIGQSKIKQIKYEVQAESIEDVVLNILTPNGYYIREDGKMAFQVVEILGNEALQRHMENLAN